MATLKVVVHHDDGVFVHLQPPCHAAVVAGRGIVNLLSTDNGKARVDAQAVEACLVVTQFQRVVIRQTPLLILLETVAAPRVVVFLQTHDVGLLVYQVVAHLLEALLVFVVAAIAADVVRHQLQCTLGRRLADIDGHIYRNRYVR